MGANKRLDDVQSIGFGRVMVAGSFAPNGSSAVSAASNKGDANGGAYTVARTSAGLFTITFADKWDDLLSFVATLQQASGGDQFLQVGTYTAASRTITVRVWDVSGAAVDDVAADANNRINFIAVFRNTSVSTGNR